MMLTCAGDSCARVTSGLSLWSPRAKEAYVRKDWMLLRLSVNEFRKDGTDRWSTEACPGIVKVSPEGRRGPGE